jgi:PIN domain nuclease of toxin-antitoxin system
MLDTHALVHYASDDPKLGRRARSAIDRARSREQAFVSSISYWEIAMLVAKRRVELDTTVPALREQVRDAGIAELALDGDIAIAAAEIPDRHNDPADRFLIATAMTRGLTLLTADAKLLAWKLRGFATQDASE